MRFPKFGAYFRAVLFLSALSVVPAQARELSKVTVNVFPGGFNWPIWVAQDKGPFARHGIEVVLEATPSSVAQMTGLSEGKFDIAMTAIDNIVAYVEGQGEAPIGPQPDFFAFMGGDNGFLSLVTVPGVKTFADVKGKTLSVDARTTGYAFVLFDMLKRNGLGDNDYKIVKAGGVLQRWDELRQRKQDGTMLITPFDILAKAQGFNQLATATQVLGHYQGLVGASRRSWAKTNRSKVIGYIRGYAEGVKWLYEPQNREEALTILEKHLPQMSPKLASESYAVLLDPKEGFFRRARMDLAGVKTVLALRSAYGEPKKKLADPMKYYDPAYYDGAMK